MTYFITCSHLLTECNAHILGLHVDVLILGGAAGVASVRRYQELPPCLIESMPACSKMDLLLARAEPISNVGRASVRMYLRRGKSYCTTAAGREK